MDTQKLSIAIQAFIKKQSTNAAYYEENWNERKERKAYYQSFTKDKLLAMTEEGFLEYISKLWAVLMWGNKKYVVDKLIEDNGFSTLKKQLADLLYGSASVEKRWDIFSEICERYGACYDQRTAFLYESAGVHRIQQDNHSLLRLLGDSEYAQIQLPIHRKEIY